MVLAPESAEPYNALGSLKASTGKAKEAEQLYKQALQNNPAMHDGTGRQAKHPIEILAEQLVR